MEVQEIISLTKPNLKLKGSLVNVVKWGASLFRKRGRARLVLLVAAAADAGSVSRDREAWRALPTAAPATTVVGGGKGGCIIAWHRVVGAGR